MRKPLLLSLLSCSSLFAQTPLPYSSGFDNGAQQAGWQEFRTGVLSSYSWGISGGDAASPPNALWHDYPVGGNEADTVRDWYVSPPFDLSQGGTVSLKVVVYSIMGMATPADRMQVMMLTGSNDPTNATSITELADLTDMVSSAGTFEDVASISVPATAGTSYIAFYYQATNNWFTLRVDDVHITGAPEGIEEAKVSARSLTLFPSPAEDVLHVQVNGALYNGPVSVFNAKGEEVIGTNTRNGAIDVSALSAGTYVLRMNGRSNALRARFTKR